MSLVNFVPKGWGFEKWIVNNEKYCGKLLYFVKGKKCSLHYHKLKDETFFIQSGKILLFWHDSAEWAANNKDKIEPYQKYMIEDLKFSSVLNYEILEKGDSFHIPPGRVHQMYALEDTELFEFSTQHFDEDSYRIIKGD